MLQPCSASVYVVRMRSEGLVEYRTRLAGPSETHPHRDVAIERTLTDAEYQAYAIANVLGISVGAMIDEVAP